MLPVLECGNSWLVCMRSTPVCPQTAMWLSRCSSFVLCEAVTHSCRNSYYVTFLHENPGPRCRITLYIKVSPAIQDVASFTAKYKCSWQNILIFSPSFWQFIFAYGY